MKTKPTFRTQLVLYTVILIVITTLGATVGAAFLNFVQTRRQNQQQLQNALQSFQKDFQADMTQTLEAFKGFTSEPERTRQFITAIMFEPSTMVLPLEVNDFTQTLNTEQAAFYFGDDVAAGAAGEQWLRYYYSRDLGGIVFIDYDEDVPGHYLLHRDKDGFAVQYATQDAKLFPKVFQPPEQVHALQVRDGKLLLISHLHYVNNVFEDISIDVTKGMHVAHYILERNLGLAIEELDRRMGVHFNLYDITGKMGGGIAPMPDLELDADRIWDPNADVMVLTDTQGDSYDAVMLPLNFGGKTIGYVSAAISQQETVRKIMETVTVLLLISFAILLLTIPCSVLLVRKFAEPLVSLSKHFSDLADVCQNSTASLGSQLEKLGVEEVTAYTHEVQTLQDSVIQMVRVIETQTKVIEDQNRTLEHKVEERTAQLRQKTHDIDSMLHNMHQGIFTIHGENRVHPEYSAYLETILETPTIADTEVMELLFSNSNLGVDTLHQITTAIGSLLGEEAIMFDFNHHMLVSEYQKMMDDGRVKILELDWDPILSDNDEIEKLMVTVRDVTELRSLQAEAEKQKRELEIIGEILSVSQKKFQDFLKTSHQFLQENEELIMQTDDKDCGVVQTLFRNMHTVKGNARTYGFQYVTDVLHEAEHTYSKLQRNAELKWDQDLLLNELHEAKHHLAEYENVYHSKLGAFGEKSEGIFIDEELLGKAAEILNEANLNNAESLRETIQRVSNLWQAVGTETLDYVLEGILQALPKLALELEKAVPEVVLKDNNIRFDPEIAPVLKDTFMHIFRNTMDHGIETVEERKAAGKPESGTITLEALQTDSLLKFCFHDNGRGLALHQIRQKAIDSGLLDSTNSLSDQEIGDLIFHSGLSTAGKISEISGRGVGMDAVKRFLQRQGGDIAIRFVGSTPSGSAYRPFQLLITLPLEYSVQVI